jgi:hypothetical protein
VVGVRAVSIRAPERGATNPQYAINWLFRVSIRAPERGATVARAGEFATEGRS